MPARAVDNGRTGLLASRGDEDGLGALLGQVGTLDPVECCREAARRFTPAAMAEEYLRLYQLVLARSRAARVLEPGAGAGGAEYPS